MSKHDIVVSPGTADDDSGPSVQSAELEQPGGDLMSKILVCGGGVIGLCVATMLGRDGHRVTVLEADPAGQTTAPVEGWDFWERPGVAQFRQPHNLSSRFRTISDQELPGLTH